MFGKIGLWEILLILVVALVIFGPAKLPELGRSIGKSINELRQAGKDLKKSIDITEDLDEDKDQAQLM